MNINQLLKSQRRRAIIYKQNQQLKRLFRKQWHLWIARRIRDFPAMSLSNIKEMIKKWYAVAVISDMERFIFLDQNTKQTLKAYMKKTPKFKVDKKIDNLCNIQKLKRTT